MKPTMFIEQKITAFANKYKVFNVSGDAKGAMIAFAQQKRIAFKEKVTFYNDESKSQELFTLRAEKVLDIHGKYFIEDMNGQLIGAFQKQFKASLTKSTWQILDANQNPTFTITESNATVAVLRRYLGYVSDLGDMVMLFFKYHFKFIDMDGVEHGRYTKTKLIRDHYRLDCDDVLLQSVDWRVLTAIAVALDALQSR